MWKIERAVEGDTIVFRVSGRMQGELLAELEKAFAVETKTPGVAVDMLGVRLADQETVRFLAMYEAQGVRLLNCPTIKPTMPAVNSRCLAPAINTRFLDWSS